MRQEIEELQTRYIRLIDDDELEAWPELFTETCLYKVITRENYDQGLALGLMECHSRGMLRDRVTGLRKINVFEPHRYSHQVSGLVIEPLTETTARCKSNYLVIRTMAEGSMTIFSAGVYLDKIVLTPEGARFEERLVIQDSRRVETLLVIPL